jgi:hypothetical protein
LLIRVPLCIETGAASFDWLAGEGKGRHGMAACRPTIIGYLGDLSNAARVTVGLDLWQKTD